MSESVSRRQFLLQLAVLGGVSLLAPSCGHSDSSADWVSVGPGSGFQTGSFTLVTLADPSKDEVYITKHADGSFLALSARCTHRGCIIAWNPSLKTFRCPCHGGQFDQTGAVIGGPPPMPLPQMATKLDTQGNLTVQIPKTV